MNNDKKMAFLTKLDKVLDIYSSFGIKFEVGDSVYNHRTASVNQTINFLKESDYRPYNSLAKKLEVAYTILRPTMRYNRKIRGSRTDAYDLQEFRRTLIGFLCAEQVTKTIEDSL